MKYRARFLGSVYERKYVLRRNSYSDSKLIVFYTNPFSWQPVGCYGGTGDQIQEWVRLKESGVVFHEDDIAVEFFEGDKIKINKETIRLKSVVKNLDGSIDYYTDREEYIFINTRDTYFDERDCKQ